MDMFVWEEKYKVGVSEFDEQHKKLISIINTLYQRIKENEKADILSNTLEELINYTNYHFESEEKLFSKYAYEHKSQHKTEHEKIKNKIAEFKTDFDSGKIIITNELVAFLKGWLDNHILENDKKYGTFLNKKGIK